MYMTWLAASLAKWLSSSSSREMGLIAAFFMYVLLHGKATTVLQQPASL
jgi:hypothetical protein